MLQDTHALFPDTPIVFMNMPPIKEFPAFSRFIKFSVGNLVRLFGKELEKTIENMDGVYFSNETIDMQKWMKKYKIKGERSEFFSDGVHPAKLAYQIWAKDVVGFIVEEGIMAEK